MRHPDYMEEGGRICRVLGERMPQHWDGQACIGELQTANYHWRQMEWIGWYNEFKANQVVREVLGGQNGPRYGNTTFDYRLGFIWDFKVHPAGSGDWTVLNDQEATDRCIADHGGVGFVMTLGVAEFNDAAGVFKTWHDHIKGGVSDYERQRVARGAPSRRRKVAFQVTGYRSIYLPEAETVTRGFRDSWLGRFQEGMRNADGSPRRAKYRIRLRLVPASVIVGEAPGSVIP